MRWHDDSLQHAGSISRVIAVPMALHGLYDMTLKEGMYVDALMTAVASFAWPTYQVESARGRENSRSQGSGRDSRGRPRL